MTDNAPELRPPHTVPRFVGVIVKRLLRSPLHRVMSGRLLLIQVTGRKSGREYVVPLSYTQDGDAITASTSVTNAWPKNLQGGAPVKILLRGVWVSAEAEPQIPTPEDIAWYLGRVPQDAKYHYVRLDGQNCPNPEDLQRAAREQLFIRIRLARPGISGTGRFGAVGDDFFEGQELDIEPAPDVFLIVGIPGSGKSSVSAELARRFPRGAHIEGDHLQELIVAGGRLPSPSVDREADRQLLLRARNASLLARSFHAAGVVPVIDDVVVRKAHLEFYLDQLNGLPLRLIVLAPRVEVVAERLAARDKKLIDDWSFLDQALRSELAGQGEWIDSTDLALRETVDTILSRR